MGLMDQFGQAVGGGRIMGGQSAQHPLLQAVTVFSERTAGSGGGCSANSWVSTGLNLPATSS
jgi:uncharacterized protein YidB (DUF937 family)